MGIKAISGGTNYDPSTMAQSIIKKLDTNNNGSISKSEFQNSLKNASATSSKDSVSLFNKFDTNNNGSVSQSELETFLKNLSATGNSASSQKNAPAKGGASSTGVTSSSSTSLYYDVRDTNHDGVVSQAEVLTYEAQHPIAAIENQNKASTSSLQKTAVSNYQTNGVAELQTPSPSKISFSA